MPTPEQNKIIARWVTALRSGKYHQGRYALERDGKFCCLGVLAHLASKAGVVNRLEPQGVGNPVDASRVAYGGFRSCLPPPVLKWAGLISTIGTCKVVNLSGLNDSGTPFSSIADLIESRPEGLFEK